MPKSTMTCKGLVAIERPEKKEPIVHQAPLFDVNDLIIYGHDMVDHGDLIVTQRNELIYATNEVALKAGKVIDALLTRVNLFDKDKDKDKVKVEISTVEIAKILGQTRQAVQRNIKDIVKELQSQVIMIPTRYKLYDGLPPVEKIRAKELNKKPSRISLPNDDGFEMVNWFHKSAYDSNKRVVTVQFHDDVVPLLVGFSSNFTQYSIKNTRHMTSEYGRGLYRIARSILSLKAIINGQYEASRFINLEEFRRVMGATQEGYDVFSELNKRVIKKALTDLENSDLKVVIQIPERPVKTSRAKITKLKIIVSMRESLNEAN